MILFTLRNGSQVAIRPQDIQEITEQNDSNYSYVRYTLSDSPHYLIVVGKVSNLVEEVNTQMNNTHVVGESI